MQSMEIKPQLWTESGLKELGRLIKQARTAKGLSLRALQDYIKDRTGYNVAYTTLGRIERGSGKPIYDTVVVIAASGFVLKENGEPYTMEELGAIASQSYVPNDLFRESDVCLSHSDNVYPKSRKGTSVMSGNWSDERTCVRVQNLIQASLRKAGLSGQPGTAAEHAGINPATFDRAALRAFESGSLSRMLGTTVNAGLEGAIASICYEVVGGWDGDIPRSLGSATYIGRPQALLRDLHLNNERQTV